MWINKGDLNSSFFFYNSTSKNKIKLSPFLVIWVTLFTSQNDIKSCFLNLYTTFWTSSSPKSLNKILYTIPDDFPSWDSYDKELLIRPVTKGEVHDTLRAMLRGKNLGPDGWNVEFYLYYWKLVGDHLFKAISHFFTSSKFPKSWGRIYVTLIPKFYAPRFVIDFRPIALCNVCIKSSLKF